MYLFGILAAAAAIFAGLALVFGWLPVALIAGGLALLAWVTRDAWAQR